VNPPAVRAVRHAGIVVEDLERSLGFYRDVLGLTVKSQALEEGPFVDVLLGLSGTRVRTVKLGAPEGAALVELLAFEAPAADARRAITVKTPGPTHVALTVHDVAGLTAALQAAGGSLVGPVQVSPDGKVQVCYARDPEGNFLELVEELPA
jgi:catechol 2,3-dioxygenase-like lactoylglutathione lyase family enzyme